MAKANIPESVIKHAWHTYFTTGNMPASLHAPWFEHKSWRPFFKALPRCRICYLKAEGMESRTLALKGKREPVDVWVMKL